MIFHLIDQWPVRSRGIPGLEIDTELSQDRDVVRTIRFRTTLRGRPPEGWWARASVGAFCGCGKSTSTDMMGSQTELSRRMSGEHRTINLNVPRLHSSDNVAHRSGGIGLRHGRSIPVCPTPLLRGHFQTALINASYRRGRQLRLSSRNTNRIGMSQSPRAAVSRPLK